MTFDNITATYVIQLIASAVNSQPAPAKPSDADWKSILEFSIKQNVLNIVGYACETLEPKPDKNIMQFLTEFRKRKAVIEAEQEVIFSEITDIFEQTCVRYLPLKGIIVKNLYPSQDMRTMGDIDFLIDVENVDEVIKILTGNGYEFLGHGDLHSNLKKGRTHIELHRFMFNESYKKLTEYFGIGFERAEKDGSKSYRYNLKDEDMYIYLLAHLAKHYRYSGTGIRSVLDLYVFRKACPGLDMEYINSQTDEIGLLKFQKKVEDIAEQWFGGEFNGEFNSVSAYIASGGVYGSEMMNNVNEMINSSKNIHAGKFKSVLSILFPNRAVMEELFPILKKRRFLLPIYWIIRWIKSLSADSSLKSTLNETGKILSVDDFYINAQRDAEIDEL